MKSSRKADPILGNLPCSFASVLISLGWCSAERIFLRTFILEPPIFSHILVWGRSAKKILQENLQNNPPGRSPAKSSEVCTTKIPDTFLHRGQDKISGHEQSSEWQLLSMHAMARSSARSSRHACLRSNLHAVKASQGGKHGISLSSLITGMGSPVSLPIVQVINDIVQSAPPRLPTGLL